MAALYQSPAIRENVGKLREVLGMLSEAFEVAEEKIRSQMGQIEQMLITIL